MGHEDISGATVGTFVRTSATLLPLQRSVRCPEPRGVRRFGLNRLGRCEASTGSPATGHMRPSSQEWDIVCGPELGAAMRSIAHWLNTIGLGQYAQRFAENYIDASVLRDLTDQDLEKIGLPLGHRKKLLRAIRELADASPATPPPATASKPAPHDSAERRQLTVMFCDLVGSTALSTRLDPEDLQEIIGAYHRCCAEVITQSGGFVARYLGDGVLAYFGYPQAHEDDAEQAVRAGLALVEAVAKLDTGQATSLHLRVGIATGLVVVGDLIGGDAAHDNEVVGATPNLAARLQAFAEPDAVVVEGGTRHLLMVGSSIIAISGA